MDKRNISIRKLHPTDLDYFYDFFSQLVKTQFPEYTENISTYNLTNPRGWTKNKFKKILTGKEGFILGAFEDDHLLGLLHANNPWGGISYASWILVTPDYQHQGIGTLLLKSWEQEVKSLGGHFLYLNTNERNLVFYKNAGFEISGHFKKAWCGLHYYYLTKLIQEPQEENYLQ